MPAAQPSPACCATWGWRISCGAVAICASLGHRSVWGSSVPGERPFLAGTRGDGWHVDRLAFEMGLAERAREAGVEWRRGMPGRTVARRRGKRTAAGVWRSRRRPGARGWGRTSSPTRPAGPPVWPGGSAPAGLRYDRLVGAAALLRSAAPATDYLYAGGSGPLGLVVLGSPRRRPPGGGLHDGRRSAGPRAFARRLVGGPGWRPGETRARVGSHGYARAEPLRILPAETSRLDRIAGEGWLALGDAAAAYDPLSSNGIGSAMGSGFYAGHAIADTLAGNAEEAMTAYLGSAAAGLRRLPRPPAAPLRAGEALAGGSFLGPAAGGRILPGACSGRSGHKRPTASSSRPAPRRPPSSRTPRGRARVMSARGSPGTAIRSAYSRAPGCRAGPLPAEEVGGVDGGGAQDVERLHAGAGVGAEDRRADWPRVWPGIAKYSSEPAAIGTPSLRWRGRGARGGGVGRPRICGRSRSPAPGERSRPESWRDEVGRVVGGDEVDLLLGHQPQHVVRHRVGVLDRVDARLGGESASPRRRSRGRPP